MISARPTKNPTARVSSKGQTTIPAEFRRQAGIAAHDSVEFAFEAGRIVMTKVQPIDQVWNAGQSAMMTEWGNMDEDVYNDLA
jgi:bifunctional DNA-binding transcriptional regulator/antitoxin component of YhaV-PrlF toxin-antitoxin module